MHKITRFEFIIVVAVFLISFSVLWLYFFPLPLSNTNYVKDSAPVTIRVVSHSPKDELHKLQIEDFLEKNSKIEVKADVYPIDIYYNVLTSELSNTNSPDIIMVEHPAVIDTLIPSDDLLLFDNHMTSGYRVNNNPAQENLHYLSPPTGINPYVIYCNSDIMSSLNINLENPTLEEFTLACERIKSNGFTSIALGARSWSGTRNMAVQLASGSAEDPWQSAMDNMRVLAPYFQKNPHLDDYYDAQVAFTQGKACFYFATENEKEKIISQCDFEPVTIHLQLDDKCTIWYDYTGMYAISMKAKNKLPALNLLKYLIKKGEHKITQDYIASLEMQDNSGNNTVKYQYKCNWMFNDNGKNIKMYIEKLMNYIP